MKNNDENLHHPHDKGYKFLLSSKKVFVQLLRSFVKQGWVDQIDETQLIRVDKSYILQDFQDKEADLVYRMKTDEEEVIFYVLMEFQSSVDFQMPYRLLLYMTEVWRSLLKDTKKQKQKRKDFGLPVIVPIVVYNGKSQWTAKLNFKETLSGYELFGDAVLDFGYILIDVNRYRKEDLLALSNLIGSVFLLDQDIESSELIRRLTDLIGTMQQLDEKEFKLLQNWIQGILTRGWSPGKVEQLSNFLEHSNPKEGVKMISNLEKTLKEMEKKEIEAEKKEKEAAKKEKEAEKKAKEAGKMIQLAEQKTKLQVAGKMLEKGMPVKEVSELTGLDLDEVKKLKQNGKST